MWGDRHLESPAVPGAAGQQYVLVCVAGVSQAPLAKYNVSVPEI
jgi:hypothetical protein